MVPETDVPERKKDSGLLGLPAGLQDSQLSSEK